MVLEKKRLQLHEYLCSLLGNRNCYFTPPTGMELKYPCIIYEFSDDRIYPADNIPYLRDLQWMVTVVDEDPESEIASKFMQLPKCRLSRPFRSDNLNHFVFTLYF